MPHFTEKGTVVVRAAEILHWDEISIAVAFPGGAMHSFDVHEASVHGSGDDLRVELPVKKAKELCLI